MTTKATTAHRYAVYFAPHPGSLGWLAGSHWLGRCAAQLQPLQQLAIKGVSADDLHRLTAAPRRYGWHATLKAPFALAPGTDWITLHQAVQEVAGLHDHRARGDDPVEVQYGLSHPVQVQPGGLLARVLARDEVMVNSVHGQGVRRLAEGLRVEALAPDGLVEAFSVADSPGFALGVQWHPEWQAADNPVSMAMLRAFGAACQDYRDLHRPPSR